MLVAFSWCLVDNVLYWSRYALSLDGWVGYSGPFALLFGPLFLGFVRVNLHGHSSIRRKDLIHLAPMALNMCWAYPWIIASAGARKSWIASGLPGESWFIGFGTLLPWAHVSSQLIYAVMGWREAKDLPDGPLKTWSKWMAYCMVVVGLSYASYYFLVAMHWLNMDWDYMISLAMSLSVGLLAYLGYQHPAIHAGEPLVAVLKPVQKYVRSQLTNAAAKELNERLELCMRTDAPYRNGDLDLEMLAQRVGSTRHNVSQVINQFHGNNFFGYVNEHRIREACALLATQRDLNIIEVAYQVGFNNKTAFNTAFKRFVGCTPTEFRVRSGKGLSGMT